MPASPSNEPSLAELLDAIDRLGNTGFHQVDLRIGRVRLRVSRAPAAVAPAPVVAPTAAAPAVLPPPAAPATPQPAAARSGEDPSAEADDLHEVTAPMVGTFYRRARPEAEPFVSLGDQVRRGQPLCIIEAMKLMNNIEADIAGEIVDIAPEDGAAVQFGDTLFRIRPR